ncbi:MAG: auracyanin family protein [Rhodothermales bacterium]|nr:auracyanin family protein [Rhodothermales bacterium]
MTTQNCCDVQSSFFLRTTQLLLVAGTVFLAAGCRPSSPTSAQGDSLDFSPDQEGYYYQRITLPIPDEVELEVGGLDILEDGRPAVSTRRGEIWFVDGAYNREPEPSYHLFAQGLHEPLGLLVKDGALYAAQRGELTKMTDEDGDDRADVFETVYAWPLTGNYHEYSFGPLALPNGNFFVSLNLGWFGQGGSEAKWRGWALEITPDGEAYPMAVGFRSPAGIGITSSGDLFYGENQGDWIGSGWITHIERGDFLGHPAGLRWTDEPGSPIKLAVSDIPNTGEPMVTAKETVPQLKLPTVWFPHTVMGISTSAIIEDNTNGFFGPFAGQLLVGDQGHSKLMRVYLEKVNGEYQGANFPFYEGFASGILRTAWGTDGSLFVGQTSRGWDATGKSPFALERVVWTGKTPFEMKEIRALPNGFDVEFTMPVDRSSIESDSAFTLTSFTYKYHSTYGSPAINIEELTVANKALSEDGRTVTLTVDGLREGYIHEFRLGDIRVDDAALSDAESLPLLHDFAYYTLNNIPGLAASEAMDAGSPEDASTESNSDAAVPPVPKNQTEMPSSWGGAADHTVTLAPVPGLQFDVTTFEVTAGSKVALRFNNDDDMLHNVVITRPRTVDVVVEAALGLGIRGQSMGFVPESGEAGDNVLHYTSLLGPEQEETIYFSAPTEPGEYPFVCTFPGHGMTMRGIMVVRG